MTNFWNVDLGFLLFWLTIIVGSVTGIYIVKKTKITHTTIEPDELIAFCALILGILLNHIPFFSGLGALALIYLFMCITLRKYEAILKRNKK